MIRYAKCTDCDKRIKASGLRCKDCYNKQRRNRPRRYKLEQSINAPADLAERLRVYTARVERGAPLFTPHYSEEP